MHHWKYGNSRAGSQYWESVIQTLEREKLVLERRNSELRRVNQELQSEYQQLRYQVDQMTRENRELAN
ncbi:MAG: hypothetical protein NZ482_09035, partial [Gloeomargarita sp. SKYG98]|nr:hypothetical protein [Gloeomargarita sp. SKYG98]